MTTTRNDVLDHYSIQKSRYHFLHGIRRVSDDVLSSFDWVPSITIEEGLCTVITNPVHVELGFVLGHSHPP